VHTDLIVGLALTSSPLTTIRPRRRSSRAGSALSRTRRRRPLNDTSGNWFVIKKT
jgi:hypothetical protein